MSPPGCDLARTKTLLTAMASEAAELRQVMGGCVTDAVAGWLAGRYITAAQETLADTEAGRRLEILRAFVQDWALLRRGDHSAARLQLEREELELRRAAAQEAREREFRDWLRRPDIRAELFPDPAGGLNPETLAKIERELRLL